jgi:cytochrome P450
LLILLAELALISSPNGVSSILTVESDVEHSRIRRVLAHAFSEKAMREQEPLIQQYIDMLIESLNIAAKKGPVDVVQWYEFVTFDIIGKSLTSGNLLPNCDGTNEARRSHIREITRRNPKRGMD